MGGIMMIEVRKMSKKAQKAYHARQRGSWNGVNPVSRTVPDKKHAYNRQAAKRDARADA